MPDDVHTHDVDAHADALGASEGRNGNGVSSIGRQGKVVTTRTRGNLSTSPLSRPGSLIHMLASRVQEYLYFPSPEPLYVVLGTIAANMMQGVPVWVMLVGPPSSGRTIMLEAMANVPKLHIVGAIKGPSALLSGTGKKDTAKTATGGLLRQIGSRGMMVMKDFTSMLSMAREPLGEAIGALREIYDGRWSRPLGADGGKILEWKGKIGFLGACTPAIDRHHSVTSELGERWVYYRYAETDGYGETIKALGVENPHAMMEELRDLMLSFVQTLELTWDDEGTPKRGLTDKEKNRLYAISSVTVAARSSVPRHPHTLEIVDIVSKEAPTRLSAALGQLYLGLEYIGLDAEEAWGIVGRIALDSVPQMRAKILITLRGVVRWLGDPKSGGLTVRELREVLQCSTRTASMVLEDLCILGLCEKKEKKVNRLSPEENMNATVVRLSEWSKHQFEIGYGRPAQKEKVEE